MSPRPIIIDCDPGTDDGLALWLALWLALAGASVPAMPGRGFLRIREEKPGWEPGEGFASFGF